MHQTEQLFFVQGAGKGTHDEWDNHLLASLLRELETDYEIFYPRMPDEENPKYAPWKLAIENALDTLVGRPILVAHSLGATILLQVLAEQTSSRSLGGLFLIAAPFIGEGGWPTGELQFPTHLGAHLPTDVPIHFFHGLADETAPASHVELYAHAVPRAHIHRLNGRDHQLNNDLKEVAAVITSLEIR